MRNADHRANKLNEQDIQSLYRYAFALCQHQQNAEDLLQAALETFFAQLKQGRAIQHPTAFVRTTIRNRFIDHYRSQQKRPEESFEEQADYDISPLDTESLMINEKTLGQVWETLNPNERDMLYHWAVLGMSTDEVCQQLDIPRGTFLSRIHRLRKRVNQQGSEPNSSPLHQEGV